jgi:hypothetical protein
VIFQVDISVSEEYTTSIIRDGMMIFYLEVKGGASYRILDTLFPNYRL